MVARLTSSSWAIEEMVLSGWGEQGTGVADLLGAMAGGRAAGRPRRGRGRGGGQAFLGTSTMSSRMNSARAVNTWKTSRPPEVVVSMRWSSG